MGKVVEFPKKRYWRQRTYDTYPQTGEETIDGHPILMSMEQVVEGILDGNANCLEWRGYPIDEGAPLLPELDRETHAICTGCNETKPLEKFYWDTRKTNQRRSTCKACDLEAQRERDRMYKANRYAQRMMAKKAA